MKYTFIGRFTKGKFVPGGVYELTKSQAINWKGLFAPVSGEAPPAGSPAPPASSVPPESSTPAPVPSGSVEGAPAVPLTAAEIVLRAQAARNAQ